MTRQRYDNARNEMDNLDVDSIINHLDVIKVHGNLCLFLKCIIIT